MRKFVPFLFLLGCLPSQKCTSWDEGSTAYVFIDDPDGKFSPEEIEIIHEDFDDWSEATNHFIDFKYVDCKSTKNLIIIRPDRQIDIKKETGHDSNSYYVPWEVGGSILFPYDIDPVTFRAFLLHEIGHTLGLDHDEEEDTIMYPLIADGQDITCRDVTNFCEQNGCNVNLLPICSG